MNFKLILKNILYVSLSVLLAGLVVFTVTNAGSLSPTLSPASTFYTLADIYTRLTTNATATEANHDLGTSNSPASTFYTLKQIYDAIPTVYPSDVLVGKTYLGVTGTALGNMWNGTSGIYTGGSQANGGADDYNNAGGPPADRYSGTWTQCTLDNNYCGTGDSGADAKDNSTNLVWSMPCNGVGCTSFSDSTPLKYSWSNGGANNNSRTAVELCSDHTAWYLPNQRQFMQGYINGGWDNVDTVGTLLSYWTSTSVSNRPADAWRVEFFYGRTNYYPKTSLYSIRCVRPAP